MSSTVTPFQEQVRGVLTQEIAKLGFAPTKEQLESGEDVGPYSLRYLRAGHSLLGGVWVGDRVFTKSGKGSVSTDAFGTPLGDSIYSTFVTQEAVRLVEFADGREAKNALVM